MPTFNQLVRKGRQTSVKVYSTCTSEGLQLFTEGTYRCSLLHRKRGVCTAVKTASYSKNLTQLLGRSLKYVS